MQTSALLMRRSGAAASAASRSVSRRASAAPPAAPLRPVVLLDGAHQTSILARADESLAQLCSSRASEEERQACYEVWRYYHDRREEAQSGCALEQQQHVSGGSGCATLDALEKMVYEVAFTGDAEQLYRLLRTQANMAKRAAAGLPSPSSLTPQEVRDSQRAKALELFARVDVDGNGVIDREEFLDAMKLLQRALGDDEMQLVFSCMDSTGYVTPEQFVSIVQAEAPCDPDCDGEHLRHMRHARPAWWSDAPHCVTDV